MTSVTGDLLTVATELGSYLPRKPLLKSSVFHKNEIKIKKKFRGRCAPRDDG